MAQINYQLEQWTRQVWQSDTRYYRAEIAQDLFGQWTLERHWSDLWHNGGRRIVRMIDSLEQGRKLLNQIHKKRTASGYKLVETIR